MQLLKVYARLQHSDQTPAANIVVALEQYHLEKNCWVLLAEKKTTRAGNLSLSLDYTDAIGASAPWLRLTASTSANTAHSWPLGFTAHMQYAAKTATLTVDFGVLTFIDNELPQLTPTQSQFIKQPLMLLGEIDSAWQQARTLKALAQHEAENLASAAPTTSTPLASANASNLVSTRTVNLDIKNTLETTATNDVSAALLQGRTNTAEIPTLTTRAGDGAATLVTAPLNTAAIQHAATQTAATSTSSPLLESLQVELARFHSAQTKLQIDLDASKILLEERSAQVKLLQSQMQETRQSLEKLQTENTALAKDRDQLLGEVKQAAPLADLANNIGQQLEAANNAMQSRAQPYRIDNIQLELRGNLLDAGKAMSLSHALDGAAASSASLVRLDLSLQPRSARPGLVRVPNLSGLTATAAERVLAALGLKLHALNQPLNPEQMLKVGLGQALRQTPDADQDVAQHSSVTVVFASAAKEYL